MRLIDADKLLVDRMTKEGMAYSESQIHDALTIEAIPKEQIEKAIEKMEEARDKDKIAEYPYNRCIKILKEACE